MDPFSFTAAFLVSSVEKGARVFETLSTAALQGGLAGLFQEGLNGSSLVVNCSTRNIVTFLSAGSAPIISEDPTGVASVRRGFRWCRFGAIVWQPGVAILSCSMCPPFLPWTLSLTLLCCHPSGLRMVQSWMTTTMRILLLSGRTFCKEITCMRCAGFNGQTHQGNS